jgi:U4/U6 small nuclear ribonucleoprotein PRP4
MLIDGSYDMTWKLWDVETGDELLLQEGHSREVHTIAFQNDGALALTGFAHLYNIWYLLNSGLDCFGRVWDLRTGRSIMLLQGHVQQVVGVDFSPCGYEVATASGDNTVRIHDIRQLKNSVYILPAHTNLVSEVKFRHRLDMPNSPAKSDRPRDALAPSLQSHYGDYVLTAGFDGTAKIWGSGDWKLLKTLAGHTNKIMSLDYSQDGKFIATASYDRTFKLWANEDLTL